MSLRYPPQPLGIEGEASIPHNQPACLAARDARARIERDLKAAPDRICPLLAHILTHLFDPNLNVNPLKLACGVQTRTVLVQFHTVLGESPRTYIESRRMEIARVLLVTSKLPVWKISKQLGFSTLETFRWAFRRRQGESPRAYRRQRQPRAERGSRRHRGKPARREPSIKARELHQALRGELDAERAHALLAYLRQIYSHVERSDEPRSPGVFGGTIALSAADTRQTEATLADPYKALDEVLNLLLTGGESLPMKCWRAGNSPGSPASFSPPLATGHGEGTL